MIRPLRKRHAAFATLFLALLAPVGLFAGVLSRPDEALMSGLPEAVFHEHGTPAGRIGTTSLELDGIAVAVRTWGTGSARFLELAPADDLRLPDVLVYWTAGSVTDASAPPPKDAVLVGSLSGARPQSFRLPPPARDAGPGSVVLYSLGHQRGLGSAGLPANE